MNPREYGTVLFSPQDYVKAYDASRRLRDTQLPLESFSAVALKTSCWPAMNMYVRWHAGRM
jgi:hypothetical protein